MSIECSVANCHQKSKTTFHSPQSRPHLELWKKILGIKIDKFYVCDQHFEDKFFRIEKRLTIDAFPTQFLGNVEAGSDDFCQCCMKSFVRSKYITQAEPRMVIEEKFRVDFEDVIGSEIPHGIVCRVCFDTIKNFIKFRNDIRQKQLIREEIAQLSSKETSALDPSIKIKEEPQDTPVKVHETSLPVTSFPVKEEPSHYKIETDTNESFLISEIKTEPEEMTDVVTKSTPVRLAYPKQRIVIKRPSGSVQPMNTQSFRLIQPQKVVRVFRGSPTRPTLSSPAKLSNSKGSINISHVQLSQMENSENLVGYKCQYCPNRFIERRFVVDHIRQKHTFKCEQCPSVFPFKITLIKHLMSMHGNAGATVKPLYKYTCGICGLKYLSQYTLDAHMLQKHKNVLDMENRVRKEENIVVVRSLKFPLTKPSNPSNQSQPMTRIVPVNPHTRPSTSQAANIEPLELGKPFRVKLEPKRPVRTLVRKILTPLAPPPVYEPIVEDPDGIPCLDCGLLLKPDKLLKHRMDAHDLDTHNLFYTCDMCGIEIRGKTHLINHMTTKHMSNSFIRCEYCDGFFETKTDLVCHKNLQHNFKGTRYECHFCYKLYSCKRDLILHRKVHYSDKDSRDKLARVFCKKFKSYEPKSEEYKDVNRSVAQKVDAAKVKAITDDKRKN